MSEKEIIPMPMPDIDWAMLFLIDQVREDLEALTHVEHAGLVGGSTRMKTACEVVAIENNTQRSA